MPDKLSPSAQQRVDALGDAPEADLLREDLEAHAEAAKHTMTTPDGDKGHPIPGELGYRAEFWDTDERRRQPARPV